MQIIKKFGILYNRIRFAIADKEQICELIRKQGVRIGVGCEINKSVSFGSEPYLITIGDYVRITSGVKFITHDGGIWVLRNTRQLPNADIFGKIVIGNNVHIGVNSIVMPNVIIGNNVIIGCGTVVTKNIPDNAVVVGVPGRVIEGIDEYYFKNKNKCDFTKSLSPEDKKKYLLKKYG